MDIKTELNNFLDKDGKLISYPSKRKMKIIALFYLASKIQSDIIYTEKEFNSLIVSWCLFNDPATIRRELYNYKFIDRTSNGLSYRLEKEQPTPADLGINI